RKNRAIVIDPIADHWPTEVLGFFHNVDLISTSWTMLMNPDLSRDGVSDHPLRISVAIRINGFFGVGLVYKRIVSRDLSIVMKPVHFTAVFGDILGVDVMITSVAY